MSDDYDYLMTLRVTGSSSEERNQRVEEVLGRLNIPGVKVEEIVIRGTGERSDASEQVLEEVTALLTRTAYTPLSVVVQPTPWFQDVVIKVFKADIQFDHPVPQTRIARIRRGVKQWLINLIFPVPERGSHC